MANTYTYQHPDNIVALRSGDSASVPWNAETGEPLDITGEAGRIWVEDGSPTPFPYIEPPPPPEPPPDPQNLVLLDHENRIRTMEGQPPITMEEFYATKIAFFKG